MQSREIVLLIGDPHLKVSRAEDAKEFLDKLIVHVNTKQYQKVVILGDLFDTFAVIRSEILSLWYNFVSQASDVIGRENLIMIVGNHDYAGAKGGTHALEPFKVLAKVIDDIDIIDIGGVNCYFMPFKRDNEEFESLAREMKGGILFCHQSFNGAKFENGFYDPHGANPDSVSHFSIVVSGHIHSRQCVGNNIYYPGTPFQQSFGEASQEKGLAVVDIGGEDKFKIKGYIDLDMPKFHVLDFGHISNAKIPKEFNPRDSYKIVAHGDPQEIAEFWKSDDIKKFRHSVRRLVDSITTVKTNDSYSSQKASTMEEKLEAFIKSRNWRSSQEDLIGRARIFLSE